MTRASVFQRYLLPGFVLQSVVIAGGYGTGRELAEFFLRHGPTGGLLSMLLVSTVIWSTVCVAAFEFARVFGAYDYRAFFRRLRGRGWVLFEACYVVLLLIILGVIAAAAGAILQETFGLPYAVGVVGIMLAVAGLVFGGSRVLERALAGWSFVLYGVYLAFFVWCVIRFGPDIGAAFGRGEVRDGWMVGGIKYAAYNLGVIPAILFAVRHAESRRDTVTAGLLAGPIAIVPGLLFYIAMAGGYPGIVDRPVPANDLLERLGSPGFQLLFQVVLFGTLIETGSGMIHAVNERIAGVLRQRGASMPGWLRPAVAGTLLIIGALLAQIGLIPLIARGYGTLTWMFLAVFVVPILTIGVKKAWTAPASPEPAPGTAGASVQGSEDGPVQTLRSVSQVRR